MHEALRSPGSPVPCLPSTPPVRQHEPDPALRSRDRRRRRRRRGIGLVRGIEPCSMLVDDPSSGRWYRRGPSFSSSSSSSSPSSSYGDRVERTRLCREQRPGRHHR